MACFNIFDVCSMQHASSTSLTYPGSCKSCFSRKPVFGGKVFLIFSIIYQIIDQHIALWSLPTIPWIPMYLFLTHLASHSLSSLLDFTEFRPVLASPTSSTLKLLLKLLFISDLIMPKLVYLMTVHEAYQEYNSLIDQIRAKYELLDSGECGSVGMKVAEFPKLSSNTAVCLDNLLSVCI